MDGSFLNPTYKLMKHEFNTLTKKFTIFLSSKLIRTARTLLNTIDIYEKCELSKFWVLVWKKKGTQNKSFHKFFVLQMASYK